MSIIDELKYNLRHGQSHIRLLLINLIVFIVTGILNLFPFLANVPFEAEEFLAVPATLDRLLFQPWGIITYMFAHAGLMHIFFNMLMFYFTGRIFVDFLGSARLTSTYLMGGLAGALLFLLAYNLFPVFATHKEMAYLIGASASVLAVLTATATYAPNMGVRIFMFGPFPLKYIAIALVAIDIITLPKGNPGGHIAHLGGALFGFIYASQLKKGRNINQWLEKILNLNLSVRRKPKMTVAHSRKKTKSDAEYLARKAKEQQRMDEILDKISKSGYESLTTEEREILFKMSKDL